MVSELEVATAALAVATTGVDTEKATAAGGGSDGGECVGGVGHHAGGGHKAFDDFAGGGEGGIAGKRMNTMHEPDAWSR
jgi:hypothetical protein